MFLDPPPSTHSSYITIATILPTGVSPAKNSVIPNSTFIPAYIPVGCVYIICHLSFLQCQFPLISFWIGPKCLKSLQLFLANVVSSMHSICKNLATQKSSTRLCVLHEVVGIRKLYLHVQLYSRHMSAILYCVVVIHGANLINQTYSCIGVHYPVNIIQL